MKNNFHKVRGKREFLFDDKELFMLSGGAIIICVLIFVLGFMVGQSLEEQSVASPLVAENAHLENELDPEERGSDLRSSHLRRSGAVFEPPWPR